MRRKLHLRWGIILKEATKLRNPRRINQRRRKQNNKPSHSSNSDVITTVPRFTANSPRIWFATTLAPSPKSAIPTRPHLSRCILWPTISKNPRPLCPLSHLLQPSHRLSRLSPAAGTGFIGVFIIDS